MTMQARSLARPYAKAIFEIANRHGALLKWLELLTILSTQFGDKDLVSMFSNPRYPKDLLLVALQKAFMTSDFGKDFAEISLFLKLLFKKQKINIIPEIVQIYRELLLKQQQCVEVVVSTARPILDEQQQQLQNVLEKRLQASVILKREIDSQLIGGVKLSFNGKVIDGSVRGRLKLLANKIQN